MVVDTSLVRDLIAAQFPDWAHLPVSRVEPNGYDNRTFRLGDDMSVRLPSHQRYAAQVDKEQEWLPRLAPSLPLSIPVPLARGLPGEGYPWPWSVYRWLEGETASERPIDELSVFAADLARFVRALHRIDPKGGPAPGEHNFFRGGRLGVYDAETRAAIDALDGAIDVVGAAAAWEAALRSAWRDRPVWVHGDLAASNLLARDGRLSAVIDFGCSAVGDPACDLAITWTFFSGPSREVFREALALDASAWLRGRGWTLWKALIMLVQHRGTASSHEREALRIIEAVVAEHRAAT